MTTLDAKPDDIPQAIWDAAHEANQIVFDASVDLYETGTSATDGQLVIARAIMDAAALPPQPVEVTEEMVEAALHGRVPGGSSVWVWIAQDDAFKPSQTARDVIRAALEAALIVPQEAVRE